VVIKENQIRAAGSVHFVIHVGVKMNKNSNPIDYLIECCEKSISTGYWTITNFNILNAKDELKRLRSNEEELKKFLDKSR
jgi:hypothetical protein